MSPFDYAIIIVRSQSPNSNNLSTTTKFGVPEVSRLLPPSNHQHKVKKQGPILIQKLNSKPTSRGELISRDKREKTVNQGNEGERNMEEEKSWENGKGWFYLQEETDNPNSENLLYVQVSFS